MKYGEVMFICPRCGHTMEGDPEEDPTCFSCGAEMEIED